ncbi:MAG TPA: MBL fold metallo-hydrolase [Candidatus Limnocylindrales bacterium]|nr:MBL fold metallo-hydrolase [Candidatus Limnocylindrales bacterium]
MRIAPSIHRLGTNSTVNAYLLEEAGEFSVVDAAMPGHFRYLAGELASIGRTLADVRAILLTHGHSDHIGFAERLRAERRVPVWIHQADAALARGEAPNPAQGTGPIRPWPFLAFLWLGLLHGGLRRPVVREVATFGDGATLDVPGSPRAILVPGHTPGSAALHVPRRDVLFVGDALATYAVTTGRRGPQIAPFTADPARALESLARLEPTAARLVLPGHGEPWAEGIETAVRRVRESAAAGTT